MKAVGLLEYGGPLVFTDVPTPTIAPDELLVSIKSTAVNLDLLEASGTVRQILPIELPWIPGHEFAGVVEQIGSDVAAWAPGDAVFGTTGMGAYAEYLAVKPAAIARKPSNLSFQEAASVPVASQNCVAGNLHPRAPGEGTNDPDPWWCRRRGRLCGAIGIACRCHRHCHGKRRPFMGLITTTPSMVAFLNSIVAGVGVAMLAGGLLRDRRTVVASLIGAGVALVLMALFFVYQKWRYDSTTVHMRERDKGSGGL
jgi:hypothetical protein